MASDQAAKELIRIGEVVGPNPEKGTVRVRFADADGFVSFDLPVIFSATHKDKRYKMPDIGEQVACLFLPNGLEEGFVLGCLYNAKDKPPANSQDLDVMLYENGTLIQYDRKSGKLTVDVQGEIDVKATGNITAAAQGNITATADGDITAQAQGNSTVEAAGNATVKAGGSVTISAPSITIEGATSIKSSGAVEISGTGPVSIKGSTVDLG
jgi:phage baseplate assembly protein V